MLFETNNKEVNKLIKEGLKGADFSTMMPADFVGLYAFDDQGTYRMEESYQDFQQTERGTYKLDGKNLSLHPQSGTAEKWTVDISGTRMLLTLEASGKLLDDILEASIKNDPEFKQQLEEMKAMGVSITKIRMTHEMRKK